jgi:hypothetical protein
MGYLGEPLGPPLPLGPFDEDEEDDIPRQEARSIAEVARIWRPTA